MHAGVGVTEGRGTDRWRTVPEAGCRSRTAGTLCNVFVNFQIFIMMAVTKALDRRMNQLRVKLLNTLPGKAHAIKRTRSKILNQYI